MATKQPANATAKPGAPATTAKPGAAAPAPGGKSGVATNPTSQSQLPEKHDEDNNPSEHHQPSPEEQKEHEKRIKDVDNPLMAGGPIQEVPQQDRPTPGLPSDLW